MTSPHQRNAVLATLIKQRIADQGTSVNAVAARTSMSEPTLRLKLRGTKDWTVNQLDEVAAQLGTTLPELMAESEKAARAAADQSTAVAG